MKVRRYALNPLDDTYVLVETREIPDNGVFDPPLHVNTNEGLLYEMGGTGLVAPFLRSLAEASERDYMLEGN